MVYRLDAPFTPWLWPLLELVGLALQLAGYLLRQKWLLPAGWLLLLVGCWQERDITLATGDALACFGLFYYLAQKP